MEGLLRWNFIFKTKKQFKIDFAYINNIISNIIKIWFQKLEILIIKVIKKENRWNINETKIMEN
jgi:hypothetical protein